MSCISFEPTAKGIKTSKIITVLSCTLPYLVFYLNETDFKSLVIYAPIWMIGINDGVVGGGITPMALIMIFYWIWYVFVGYASYQFAYGKYSSTNRYIGIVSFITLIAIIFSLSLNTMPSASSGGIAYYAAVVPIPLVSILSLLLIPLLRPIELISSWQEPKENSVVRISEQ